VVDVTAEMERQVLLQRREVAERLLRAGSVSCSTAVLMPLT
jgi:hypothetical protein